VHGHCRRRRAATTAKPSAEGHADALPHTSSGFTDGAYTNISESAASGITPGFPLVYMLTYLQTVLPKG
jgi:hypothetical protein